MKNGHTSSFFYDSNGNPSGGGSFGIGFAITWQNGPLGTGQSRKEPNGAFVEDIIDAALTRLKFLNNSKFHCNENEQAMRHLREALEWLDQRTQRRQKENKEGTHVP